MAKLKADLDLHKLEIFYWVAELKSFSQAAERLSLRQPTVSAHVQELEKVLGGKVLYRIPGKVSLTPLGVMLADRAKNLLAFKRETVAAVEQFHGTLTGELWVGGSNNPGEYLLPQKLGAFNKKYPGVKPILRIGDSAGIVQDVLDGKVELGFVGFKGKDRRLSFQKIWKDEMVLAVPKDHPWSRHKFVALSDLRSEKFISRERGSGTLDSLRQLLAKKRQSPDELLNVAMELGSTEAVKEALLAGYGISILSRTSIKHELTEGSIVEVPIRGLTMTRDFYEVFHKHRPLHPIAQAFREFLKHS
ncbi:MAG: LysR family transcriptional regulator [Deltaproteobacteria bacterium]|nr:LysR family transcriptional regulator [Deltaproteobacteria bacterium]MBI2229638.1 LysR family transcriptional regulator [Deltaproteobacteria bacterium]MBI2366160.1 LysR family transcriptional regulator [Deltaproteobacteria bacterium]MBI3063592.1 LysR family transcriptional regulator [Deltaproteobacteria bacterium]